MNPKNIETVIKNIVGWIYDFNNDHARFPKSLEDLADNKAEKHSYNPKRALESNKKIGFNIDYKILEDGSFELIVKSDEKLIHFSSNSGKYTRG
jgi:hypothetical protein